MATRKMLATLDMGGSQIINFVVQVLATAPSSPAEGTVYYDSTLKLLRVYNGSAWVSMEQNVAIDFGEQGDIASSAPGDTAAAGATGEVADAGHKHARESFASTASTQSMGDTASAGSGSDISRGDHRHAMPAFGSVTAQTSAGASSSDGSSSSVARADHTHGTPSHTSHGSLSLSTFTAPTADISAGGYKITNAADGVAASDVATVGQVQAAVAGLSWKDSVRVASSSDVTISGPGSSIDGVSLSSGDRVLLYGQSTGSQNGVWVFNGAAAAMTRATDADSQSDLLGMAVFIEEGTDAGKQYILTTDAPITVGTTTLAYSQFGASSTYIAGDALGLAGSTFNVQVASGGGISIVSDELKVDRTKVPFLYATSIGDGSTLSYTVTHNLGTLDCIVQVFANSGGAQVEADVTHATTNTVTVAFNTAPTSNQYRVVCLG